MAVFAISDLHLSFGSDKPMDVFGQKWANHAERLAENWMSVVEPSDTVLLPGDLSWAIDLEEAIPDFLFLENLPGHKIISKGNHDYWWNTLNKLNLFFKTHNIKTISILHNNAIKTDAVTVCGTRGWISPDQDEFTKEDERIWLRELERFRLSCRDSLKYGGMLIAMLHYPPFDAKHRPNAFSEILREYNIQHCIYGHIHGKDSGTALFESIGGITYSLVAADNLEFKPLQISFQ